MSLYHIMNSQRSVRPVYMVENYVAIMKPFNGVCYLSYSEGDDRLLQAANKQHSQRHNIPRPTVAW